VNPYPNKIHSLQGEYDYFCPECIIFYRSALSAAISKEWRPGNRLSSLSRILLENVVICCGIGCSVIAYRHRGIEHDRIHFCCDECLNGYLNYPTLPQG
jgi:hypothetical protein